MQNNCSGLGKARWHMEQTQSPTFLTPFAPETSLWNLQGAPEVPVKLCIHLALRGEGKTINSPCTAAHQFVPQPDRPCRLQSSTLMLRPPQTSYRPTPALSLVLGSLPHHQSLLWSPPGRSLVCSDCHLRNVSLVAKHG